MDNLQSKPGMGKVDVEPERRLLGCVLNFPAKLPACEGLRSGDFFAPQHGAVWEGIAALHQEGMPLDRPIDVSVPVSYTHLDVYKRQVRRRCHW